MFDQRGGINANMVGKPATFIAQNAGIDVPSDTQVLVAELQGVGREYPLSREKLSPVLSFYTVDNWRDGCERCIELLEFGGIGHTLVIHSSDEDIILKFALEKPAFRILVNTQAALGAVGFTTNLLPSLTLGPGTFGGSIISDNVSAKHMFNIKRLAFETRPINPPEKQSVMPVAVPAEMKKAAPPPSPPPKQVDVKKISPQKSWIEEIEERIRLKAGNVPPTKQEGKSPTTKAGTGTLGSGISEDDVEKIIREFSKR